MAITAWKTTTSVTPAATKGTTPRGAISNWTTPKTPLNKFGTDVTSHPFNPLNQNSQATDPNTQFPKFNPIKDTAKQLIPAVKDTVIGFAKGLAKPFVEAGVGIVNQARNVQSVVKAVSQGKSTAMDYSERQYNVPLYGQAAPMFTGKETAAEGSKKVVANALEIAPYFLAVPEFKSASKVLETVGSKSIADVTAKEAGQFTVAYAKKLLVSSVSLGTMFGGGQSLKENANLKQTGINILRSVGTVAVMEAFLSPVISKVIGRGGSQSLEKAVDKEVLVEAQPEIAGFPRKNPIPPEIQAQVAPVTPKMAQGGEITSSTIKITPKDLALARTKFDETGTADILTGKKYGLSIKDEGDFIQVTAGSKDLVPIGSVPKISKSFATADEAFAFAKDFVKNQGEAISPKVVSQETPKVTKAASDINTELVSKGFDKLSEDQQAKFDPITKKATVEKVANFMTDMEKAKETIRTGEAPGDFKAADKQVLFNAMEEQALKNNDVQGLIDLAQSPIATELSVTGQTLGASGFNKAEGAVSAIRDIVKARETPKAKEAITKDVASAVSEIKKVHTKQNWTSFVESLRC